MLVDVWIGIGLVFVAAKLVSTVWCLRRRRRGLDSGREYEIAWWITKVTPPVFIVCFIVVAHVLGSAPAEIAGWGLLALVALLLTRAFVRRARTRV